MSNQTLDLALLWAVWLAFWWVLIPAHIIWRLLLVLAGLVGAQGQLRLLSSKTVGWMKMKVGFWQLIKYSPSVHERGGFGAAPDWVQEAIDIRPHRDQTFELTGRSFNYRIELSRVSQKAYRVKYYRKLKTPRYRRLGRTFLPRYPRTRTEWGVKLVFIASIVLGVAATV
jgi:hypothetical protein